MSNGLADALRDEAHEFAQIEDSVERVKAVNDFFAQVEFELEQFADVRDGAVVELRNEGWSYDRIAEATGLSKARVAQLAQAARAGGRRPR